MGEDKVKEEAGERSEREHFPLFLDPDYYVRSDVAAYATIRVRVVAYSQPEGFTSFAQISLDFPN